MEYRKRTLSGSWEDLPLSLDERLEQASRNLCVRLCQLGISMIGWFTNLTHAMFRYQRVPDNKLL